MHNAKAIQRIESPAIPRIVEGTGATGLLLAFG